MIATHLKIPTTHVFDGVHNVYYFSSNRQNEQMHVKSKKDSIGSSEMDLKNTKDCDLLFDDLSDNAKSLLDYMMNKI